MVCSSVTVNKHLWLLSISLHEVLECMWWIRKNQSWLNLVLHSCITLCHLSGRN